MTTPTGSLAAAPQPERSRVMLTLTWPEVTEAYVARVDPGGSQVPVRGADPLPVVDAAVVFDHEAPLDVAVRYVAVVAPAPGQRVESPPVVLGSLGRAWLKHLGRPALNVAVTVREMAPRMLPSRRAVHRIIGRDRPVVVHDVRLSDEGALTVQTNAGLAEAAALRALLQDGSVLLLQLPGQWGGETLYVSVGDVEVQPVAPRLGASQLRRLVLPFVVVDAPTVAPTGAAGATWADADAAYPTWAALRGGEPTWLDLAQQAGP